MSYHRYKDFTEKRKGEHTKKELMGDIGNGNDSKHGWRANTEGRNLLWEICSESLTVSSSLKGIQTNASYQFSRVIFNALRSTMINEEGLCAVVLLCVLTVYSQ